MKKIWKIIIGVIGVILLIMGVLYCTNNNYNEILPQVPDNKEGNIKYKKIEDTNLKGDKDIDTSILVRYNGILYGRGWGIYDFISPPIECKDCEFGKIDKLINENLVPALDGETNTEEFLNSIVIVYKTTDESIVLHINNDDYVFKKINEE